MTIVRTSASKKRLPLYDPGDAVIATQEAARDYAYALIGQAGTVQRATQTMSGTYRYRVRFDHCPGFASICSLRESALDPVCPRTPRQHIRATKQRSLWEVPA